jgi:hypothetical protein
MSALRVLRGGFRRLPAVAAALALVAMPLPSTPVAGADAPVELAVVVSSRNQAPIALSDLAPIFTTTKRDLGDGKLVTPFNLLPKSAERVVFDKAVLSFDPDDAASFWIDRKIRGGNAPPRQVPDAGLMLRVVAQLDDAIGYVPASGVDATVRVVARVRNGKLAKP